MKTKEEIQNALDKMIKAYNNPNLNSYAKNHLLPLQIPILEWVLDDSKKDLADMDWNKY